MTVLNFLAPLCTVYVTVVGRPEWECVSTTVRSADHGGEDWSYGEDTRPHGFRVLWDTQGGL